MELKEEHKQVLREALADDFRGTFQARDNGDWYALEKLPNFFRETLYRYVPYKEPPPVLYDLKSFIHIIHARGPVYVRRKGVEQPHYHVVTGYYEDGLRFCDMTFSWENLAEKYEWADSTNLGSFHDLPWKPFTR